MPTSPSNAAVLFPRISTSYIDGSARSIRHRQQECHKLQHALVDAKSSICAALQDDNGYSEAETLFEYGLTLRELRTTYENISLDAENASARAIERGRYGPRLANGVGMVYIITARSKSCLYNILSPVISAIAAGNCVIVEMPNTTRKLTSILPNVLGQTLSKDTFALSDTLPPASFLQHCLVVQQNESDSATLEKLRWAKTVVGLPPPAPSFCFVDRTADLDVAVQSVFEAAFTFRGSSPYAPDVVFLHEAVERDFRVALKQLAGATPAFSSTSQGSASGENKWHCTPRPSVDVEEEDSIGEVVLDAPRERIVSLRPGYDTCSLSLKPHLPFPMKCSTWYQNLSSSPPTNLCHKKTTTAATVSHIATLCIASTKSLDDAINWAEDVIGDPFRTAAGAFIFASSVEANYLAKALNADVTCINSFPPELLVGSRWPRPIKINLQDPSTLLHRYARELFEEERVVVFGPSPVSQSFQAEKIDVLNAVNNTTPPMAQWVKRMQLPLNPTNQRLGRRMDFFEGALLTTIFAVVLPAIVCLGMLGKFSVGKLDGRYGV